MIIARYLAKEVYTTLLASTAVLLILLISNQFVRYLAQAAVGIMPLRTVMQIVSLQMPLLLPILLPLGLYVGILIAYGRLYSDREMIVLWSCGFSKAQLIALTMAFSSVIVIIIAVLTLYFQPSIETYKRHVLLEAASASPLERVSPDEFVPLRGGELTFYAQGLSRDHKRLKDIFVAHLSNQKAASGDRIWDIVVAKEGYQTINAKTRDRFLVLKDGYRYQGVPGQTDYQIVGYQEYGARIEKNAIPAENRADTMSTLELLKKRHGNHEMQAELQWRISLPLSGLILSLLAIALSKIDPRQGRYAQLVPAFLLYILYVDLLFVSRAWLKKGQISPGIGLWWVHGLMLIIALFLLGRFMGWRFGKIGYQPMRA